jgi:outer membrane receptor protein involved in Fe transport
MKKTLLLTAAVFCAPSFANQNYMALELGAGEYNMSGNLYDANKKHNKKIKETGLIGLKAGRYLNENIRVYGYLQANPGTEIDHIGYDGRSRVKEKHDAAELGAGADYLHHITKQFYLLSGANLGIYRDEMEYSFDGGAEKTKDKNTGAVLGANLGMGYHFTEQFSMELGYRYSHYINNEHDFYINGQKATINFDGSHVGYVNASYSF